MSAPAILPKLSCQAQVPRIVGGQCLCMTASVPAFLTETRAQQAHALPWVACVILGYWNHSVHFLRGEQQLMSFPFSWCLLYLAALQDSVWPHGSHVSSHSREPEPKTWAAAWRAPQSWQQQGWAAWALHGATTQGGLKFQPSRG